MLGQLARFIPASGIRGQWANGAMGSNYAAPVAPEDVGTIVDYLTALKGRNKSE
jgi:hypothetical protein